jgi:hypothetical protein
MLAFDVVFLAGTDPKVWLPEEEFVLRNRACLNAKVAVRRARHLLDSFNRSMARPMDQEELLGRLMLSDNLFKAVQGATRKFEAIQASERLKLFLGMSRRDDWFERKDLPCVRKALEDLT